MSSGLIKMKEELHHRVLTLRSIEAMVNHPRFDNLWEESTIDQKRNVIKAIRDVDKEAVLEWVKNHPSLELADKSVTVLREMAYRMSIKNYSRLSKPELIRSIKQNGSQ